MAGPWLVGEVVNHVGLYGYKAAEVVRRFNVGLVSIDMNIDHYEYISNNDDEQFARGLL